MADSAGNILVGADSAQVDKYIEGSYENAWKILANLVPKQWLNRSNFSDDATVFPLAPNRSYKVGCFVLPSDWYMLSYLKLSTWNKAVFEAVFEDDRVAAIQSNPYTRGSVLRPVCVISTEMISASDADEDIKGEALSVGTNQHDVLKYYTSTDATTNPGFIGQYIPAVTPLTEKNDEEELNLSTELQEPLAYITAGCVFTIFGQDDMASRISEKGMIMIPGYKRVRGDKVTYKQ